jgi:hypothetical protein
MSISILRDAREEVMRQFRRIVINQGEGKMVAKYYTIQNQWYLLMSRMDAGYMREREASAIIPEFLTRTTRRIVIN